MNAVRVLVYKGFARFLRNRTAVGLTFFIPIAMIYIFGEVFGLSRKDSGPAGIRLAVVNASSNRAAQRLVEVLQQEKAFRVITTVENADKTSRPLVEADLRPMIESGAFRFAVLIPAPPTTGRQAAIQLKILSNPLNEIEAQTVNGLLQKTIFSNVPELLGQALQATAERQIGPQGLATFNRELSGAIANAFGGDREEINRSLTNGDFGLSQLRTLGATETAPAGSKAGSSTDVFSRIIKIETEQVVGKNVKSPAATRVVGGWAIMFLMFALNGTATSLFEEKKTGMFQRLLAAPVTRAHILWSRFIFGILLGLVQLVTIFSFGSLLYGIDVASHLGNLAVVSLLAAAACTALGLFIASISSSPEAAQGLATFLILTMSACGGAWFPISFMPEFMQQIAKFTLTYWAMEGFAQVLWAGRTFTQLLPIFGILTGITAAVMALAIWRFNRGRLFD